MKCLPPRALRGAGSNGTVAAEAPELRRRPALGGCSRLWTCIPPPGKPAPSGALPSAAPAPRQDRDPAQSAWYRGHAFLSAIESPARFPPGRVVCSLRPRSAAVGGRRGPGVRPRVAESTVRWCTREPPRSSSVARWCTREPPRRQGQTEPHAGGAGGDVSPHGGGRRGPAELRCRRANGL